MLRILYNLIFGWTKLMFSIGPWGMLGIGAASSIIGGLLSDDAEGMSPSEIQALAEDYASRIGGLTDEARKNLIKQITDSQAEIRRSTSQLRSDQQSFYQDARRQVNQDYANLMNDFNSNLNALRQDQLNRYPERQAEIQNIFSENNPQIQAYMDQLRDNYQAVKQETFNAVKRANQDEIRRWTQRGVTGGTIGRMIAGNQMTRLRQAQNQLGQEFAKVLQPQAQLAQQSIASQLGAEQQQEQALQQLGQAGLQGQTQIGSQLAGTQAQMGGQNLQNLLGIGQQGQQLGAGISQTGIGELGALERAGIGAQADILGRGVSGSAGAQPGQAGGLGGLFTTVGGKALGTGLTGVLSTDTQKQD